MSTQPPYRMPCEAVSGKPVFYFGSPNQHSLGPQLHDKYVNSTTVPNWNTEVGGTIAPYERYTPDPSGPAGCETHSCDPEGAPCSAWLRPFTDNSFSHASGDQVDFAVSKKRGFKNLMARRFWSGVFGYGVARDGGIDTVECCGDGSLNKRLAYRSAIANTKFLTLTIAAENKLTDYSYDGSGDLTGTTVTWDDTVAVTQSIDPTTGLLSFSGFAPAPNSDSNHALASVGTAFWTAVEIVGKATSNYLGGTPGSTTTCADNSITVKDSDGRIIETLVWDLAAGTADHKTYQWSGTGTQFLDEEIIISFSDAGLFYSDVTNTWSSFGGADLELAAKNEIYVNATLGGANTSASIYADIVYLLSLWMLNDDALYPWRTDSLVSAAPLISRDEVYTSSFTDAFYTVNDDHTLSLVTADTRTASGAILGAPQPAGYQNYFSFSYNDWAGCCYNDGEGTITWDWYQMGWGMAMNTFNSATGAQLPLNATQWTNYFQSVNKPQGAFLFYNEPGTEFYGSGCASGSPSGSLDGGALWGCKYVEILDQWNSQNFAIPAGDAKFWYDETRVYCAANLSGSGYLSTWTITNPDGTTPDNSTDFSGIWGGPSVGGFYNVHSYASGVLTLDAKVYNVPSNWASRSNGDDAMCFGKLRFPTYPSLLGRIAITPDMAGTTMTFAAAQPAFGMAIAGTEQVDLYDSSMTLLASNVAASRIDDSNFSLLTPVTSAAFVTIHGAAAWYMNDPAPKGDYALLQWWSDFRSYGEYQRLTGILDCSGSQVAQPSTNTGGGPIDVSTQFAGFTQTPGCLPFAPCGPKVVCISPNGEVFPNGKTYAFPDTFVCDEQYGSKWWAYVQATMTDLFWQAPHRPCNFDDPTTLWKMDDGSCITPDATDATPPIYYYAHSPTVEARLTVPCNYGVAQDECAPALPSGIQIGWSSPVTNIYGTADIALPPIPPGASATLGKPNGASTAWSFHALLCAHSTGCRFNYSVPGC